MASLPNEQPMPLTFATNPKWQVIFAILILFVIILFNSFFYIFRPYDGMEVYQEAPLGEVYKVYPGGPADMASVRVGDQILAIDNKLIDPSRSEPLYRAGIKPGDTVRYELERQGIQISLPLTIGRYSDNLTLLGSYLGIQFLSIGLWLIGLVLTLFAPQDDARSRLLSIGFLTAGLTAAVGGASGWNSFWGANTIQKVLLSLLALVIVSAHLAFPSVSLPRYRKVIISLVFAIAALLSVLVMINDWILKPLSYPLSITYGIYLRQVVLIFFMLSWLVAVALLIRNRFLSHDPEIRRQTGIVIWGMVLGFGPFFAFTLLPYTLFGQEYLAGSYTILFMLILPLAYAFVIFQRKLLKVDFIINRIVVWFTLIMLILIASILIFGLLVVLFHLPSQIPIFGGLIAVLIALPFTSLSKGVQAHVDRVLYGSHYDFVTVTSNLSSRLAQPLDRNRLVELLTQHLPKQMGIQQAVLFFTDGDRLEISGTNETRIPVPVIEELCQALLMYRRPVRAAQLWGGILSANTQICLKDCSWVQVYAPLIAEGKLQGILMLGLRTSGNVYSDEDLRIIATVAEQGALASTNLVLVETLRGLAQQLVRTEEEQRKRLANDLHDTVLQELFYIKQGLRRNPSNPELLDYLDELIQNLRQMIKTQRPPLLNQGLPLALQGLVEDMQKRATSSTVITWQSNLDGNLLLNDEQATSVYRIAQEALNNAIKHARAQRIEVKLNQDTHGVVQLQVKDDGIGTSGPDKDMKMDPNHFGWVLMQERATMIGADLKIHTHLGEGTTVILEVQS
jgi:two-component system sensor histidine kinase ComP